MRQHPNQEIDVDCACVACVRAKLRARDDSAVARGGLIKFVGWSGPPAARGRSQDALWVIVFRIHVFVFKKCLE